MRTAANSSGRPASLMPALRRGLRLYDWTAVRPGYGQSMTVVTAGLLHCGLCKSMGQHDCGYRVSGVFRHCDLNDIW